MAGRQKTSDADGNASHTFTGQGAEPAQADQARPVGTRESIVNNRGRGIDQRQSFTLAPNARKEAHLPLPVRNDVRHTTPDCVSAGRAHRRLLIVFEADLVNQAELDFQPVDVILGVVQDLDENLP